MGRGSILGFSKKLLPTKSRSALRLTIGFNPLVAERPGRKAPSIYWHYTSRPPPPNMPRLRAQKNFTRVILIKTYIHNLPCSYNLSAVSHQMIQRQGVKNAFGFYRRQPKHLLHAPPVPALWLHTLRFPSKRTQAMRTAVRAFRIVLLVSFRCA